MSDKPGKKFVPKTKPTGHVSSTAKRGPGPDAKDDSPEAVQSVKAWRTKVAYMQERGRWETMKAGKVVQYQPPGSYDGKRAIVDEENNVLEKAQEPIWDKLVAWCEKRDIPPEEYVRQCFKLLKMSRHNAPEPKQLMGDVYLDKWNETKDKREEEVKLELRIQREIALRHLTVHMKVYERSSEVAQITVIAEGESLGLSPLFRYCLAVAGDTKDIRRMARRLLAEAVLQFESSRKLYKRHWKDVLPEGFSKQSKELYPYLLQKLWTSRKNA